jgi:geranylgeranyl pyrophosphate synthase
MPNARLDYADLLAAIRRQAVTLAAAAWPDLGALVDASLSEPLAPFALLPVCTALACGGKAETVTPVAAAVVVAALALRIVDDCTDGDNPNALYLEIGTGRAVNVAAAFSMAALQALRRCPFPAGNSPTPLDGYLDAFLRVCAGQDQELQLTSQKLPQNLDDYCAIVQAKTVAAYEFAAWVGARCVTADETLLARCQACGNHLGWMVQMLDDIEALWFADGPSDLALGRLTFPVLYGLMLDHSSVPLLASLCQERPYDVPLICALLDKMEVRPHLMAHALDHRDQALAALDAPLAFGGRDALQHWLNWTYRDGARLLGKSKEA